MPKLTDAMADAMANTIRKEIASGEIKLVPPEQAEEVFKHLSERISRRIRQRSMKGPE
jgi:hypothetical protein